MSIDAHHHPASKLASVADHLLTALSGLSLQKSKNRENRLCLDVNFNLKYYVIESPFRREIGQIEIESYKMREEDKGDGLFNGGFAGCCNPKMVNHLLRAGPCFLHK